MLYGVASHRGQIQSGGGVRPLIAHCIRHSVEYDSSVIIETSQDVYSMASLSWALVQLSLHDMQRRVG